MKARRRLAPALVFLALVGAALSIRLLAATPAPAAGRVPKGHFVFLYIREVDSNALLAVPARLLGLESDFDSARRMLFVTAKSLVPSPRAQVVALFHVLGRVENLYGRPLAIERVPGVLPIARDLVVTRGDGTPGNIVINRNRLLGGNIEILAVEPNGTLAFRYGGREFRLPADSTWNQARILRDGVVEVVDDSPEIDDIIAAADDAGLTFTTLGIINFGLWRHADVSVTGP